MMTMTKLKTALIVAAIAAVLTPALLQHSDISALRRALESRMGAFSLLCRIPSMGNFLPASQATLPT